MSIIINNPKSGGGKDLLPYRISNLGSYSVSDSNITSLKDYAFYNDQQLTSVNFSNLTTAGRYALQECNYLTSVNFPETTSLGEQCFNNCDRLTEVIIPKVTQLGRSCFGDCVGLININLPSLTTTADYSFYQCTHLQTATFSALTRISTGMFQGCVALQSITLGSSTLCTLAATGAIPATSTHHITIYVPAALIDSYKVATNWSTLYNNGYITFSPISDGSSHTVSVSSFTEDDDFEEFYSLDNGSTWTKITATGTLSTTATQIKFKITAGGNAPVTRTIVSSTLGLNLSKQGMSAGSVESSNYTLTGNVTDIIIGSEL